MVSDYQNLEIISYSYCIFFFYRKNNFIKMLKFFLFYIFKIENLLLEIYENIFDIIVIKLGGNKINVIFNY